jgi:hypothetical protein
VAAARKARWDLTWENWVDNAIKYGLRPAGATKVATAAAPTEFNFPPGWWHSKAGRDLRLSLIKDDDWRCEMRLLQQPDAKWHRPRHGPYPDEPGFLVPEAIQQEFPDVVKRFFRGTSQ